MIIERNSQEHEDKEYYLILYDLLLLFFGVVVMEDAILVLLFEYTVCVARSCFSVGSGWRHLLMGQTARLNLKHLGQVWGDEK